MTRALSTSSRALASLGTIWRGANGGSQRVRNFCRSAGNGSGEWTLRESAIRSAGELYDFRHKSEFWQRIQLGFGKRSPTSVAHGYKNAYVQSWNFNIQQQLGNDFGLIIGYFANKGTDLNVGRTTISRPKEFARIAALSASSPIAPGRPLGNILRLRERFQFVL